MQLRRKGGFLPRRLVSGTQFSWTVCWDFNLSPSFYVLPFFHGNFAYFYLDTWPAKQKDYISQPPSQLGTPMRLSDEQKGSTEGSGCALKGKGHACPCCGTGCDGEPSPTLLSQGPLGIAEQQNRGIRGPGQPCWSELHQPGLPTLQLLGE